MVNCGFNRFAYPAKPVLTRWEHGLRLPISTQTISRKPNCTLKHLQATTKKIGELKKAVEDPAVQRELFAVTEFRDLPRFITRLERQGLSLDEQVDIINEGQSQPEWEYLVKLERSLEKNPDFKKLTSCDEVEFRIKTRFAPLVSVDVDRLLSFKVFFRSNAIRFWRAVLRNTW